jgi:hypothetical protein
MSSLKTISIQRHLASACVAVVAVGALGAAALQHHSSLQGLREVHMIAYTPDARSQILSVSHILLVRVSSAHAGEWSRRVGFGMERRVELTLQLDEVLKGRVNEPINSQVRITVNQADTGIPRDAKMPGLWSGMSIEPESRFVAFSRAPEEHSSAALLEEPKCLWLMPAASALFDVHLATETSNLGSVESVLERFAASASKTGFLYPDYLMELRGREIVSHPTAFGLLAETLESPKLEGPARVTLLQAIDEQINLQTEPPQQTIDRFIVALFRLLKLAQADSLHQNIIDSYLPAFVPKSSAESVFERYPGERQQARELVSRYPGSEGLLKWLN